MVGRSLIAITLLSAFGPYIAPGVRTEQVAVYGLAALCLALAATFLRLSGPTAVALLSWTIYAAVAAVGAADPPANETRWPFGSAASGIDNVLVPLAVSVIALTAAVSTDPRRLVRLTSAFVVVLMAVNTLAAVAQQRGADWSAWWSTNETFIVAESAADNGRFSGLINQPAEAGLLYGIALLCAVYMFRDRPWWLFLTAAMLVYGGAVTVSKVFLLIALPIGLWQMARLSERRAERTAVAVLVGSGAYFVIQAGWLPEWTGGDQLQRMLPSPGESFLAAVSASRFGESSTLQPLVEAVWSTQPLFGYGAAGVQTAYDNGWVEAFVTAGLVGVLCYTVALLAMASAWRRAAPSAERRLLGGLVLLVVGASFGIPALTANRAASVVWLLAIVLMLHQHRVETAREDDAAAGVSSTNLPLESAPSRRVA